MRLPEVHEGDVAVQEPPTDLWSALHKIAYGRGGQYELISTLRSIAREAIEARAPDATPARATNATTQPTT